MKQSRPILNQSFLFKGKLQLRLIISKFKRLFDSISSINLSEVLYYLPEYSVELFLNRFDKFDLKYKVETNTSVAPSRDSKLEAFNDAELYWPTREKPFDSMITKIHEDYSNFSFIDVGCGKGRVMIMAAKFPFKTIHGIELSNDLARKCEYNLTLIQQQFPNVTFNVHNVNALNFQLPIENLFLYLFDPFGRDTLKAFLNNLKLSAQQSKKRVIVLYYLPRHKDVFVEAGFKIISQQKRNFLLQYPWIAFEFKTES